MVKNIQDIFAEFKEASTSLERAVAGYAQLSGPMLPEGNERRKGLPIFRMAASADGHNTIEVCLDLRKLDPAYINHVLVPLLTMQGYELLESLEETAMCVNELRELFAQPAPTPQPPQPARITPP